jgi:hypothetical protein
MESPFLIMADPAALEGLTSIINELPKQIDANASSIAAILNDAGSGFQVYVHKISDFTKGIYEIKYDALVAAADNEAGATIDTGAMILFDFARIKDVLSVITWETYDFALQIADNSRFDTLTEKLGSCCYALMNGSADAAHCFTGDGKYRLKENTPIKIG